ncbi:hypothetical protein ACIA8R_34570 [Nonomuraea sp. NPDC051191]|uniref:hypothetical protein n=1 Tax=Nonomuraea sp. NPDC051191 TaxID=3364372 RepID=UPI0037AA9469
MKALGRLYEVFGAVGRPASVSGCPHCVEPGEEACLLSGPVSAIEAGSLARYAAKALTTWGDVPEFRYFLPRLLECAAADAFSYPDPEIVLGKLAVAGWHDWPAAERTAVTAFLHEWWHDTLHRHPSRPLADTVLCAVAATGVDLAPFLDAWAGLESDAAIAHLHDFVTGGLSGQRLTNAFWDRDAPAHAQVLAWLAGGPAARAVEAAFARESREPVLGLLADVHQALPPRS